MEDILFRGSQINMAAKQVALYLVLISTVIVQASTVASKSMSTIQQVKRKGPYLGVITVYSTEENAFFSTGAFRPHPTHPFVDLSGRRFRVGKISGKKVIYVKCGIGLVNAVAVAQQMLDVFGVRGIVHFGIAGNLNDSMSIGDVTIPKQFVHTGIWDWMNPNGTVDATDDFAKLDLSGFNVPKGGATSLLALLGYRYEEFNSKSGEINTPKKVKWFHVTKKWLQVAQNLEGMELGQCLNATFCLPQRPKLVVGLKGTTADIFLNNAAYRDFLFQTFQVSSADMESQAIIMTSLSNGLPVIVIRGLSDLAGNQDGDNQIQIYGTLAARNTANAVIRFLKELPTDAY